VVRTFGQGDFQFNNVGGGSVNPTLPFSANSLSTAGGGYVAVEYVFIQFAGFTFGKSASAYATPWQGFPGNINSNLLGGQNTDTGVTTFSIPPSSEMACRPRSVSTIRPCGIAPLSTT
jgi:hypothetical protein